MRLESVDRQSAALLFNPDCRRRRLCLPRLVISIAILCGVETGSGPTPAQSDSLEAVKAGVVQLASDAGGIRRIGSGIIVSHQKGAAYIVTVSHVIEGDAHPEVTFFKESHRTFEATVEGIDSLNPKGLAVIIVRGNLPSGLRALQIEPGSLAVDQQVRIIGFNRMMGVPWVATDGKIVGRRGPDLVFTGVADEGNSGGPLISRGKVAGVVTGVLDQFGYAVPAGIVLEALRGGAFHWTMAIQANRSKSFLVKLEAKTVRR